MTSRRRSATFLSALAGASLIVAASGNAGASGGEEVATTPTTAPEDTTAETTADTTAATTAGTEGTTAGTTEDTASEGTTATSEAAGAEPGGSACGIPHGPYEPAAAAPAGEVRVAWNQAAYSFNSVTSRGNATANNNPLYLMTAGGFNYYDAELNLVNNDQFGTCTLDSLDPLTITYTINEGVTWSDGTPVDAADIVLSWAGQSGVYNDANSVVTSDTGVTAQADENGMPVVIGPDGAELSTPVIAGEEATPEEQAVQDAYDAAFDPETGALLEGFTYKESTGVSFDGSSESLQLVTTFPEISEDGRSATLTWDNFYVDYEIGGPGVGVPAHVVGQLALGIEDPTEAKAALLAALQDGMPTAAPAEEATATTEATEGTAATETTAATEGTEATETTAATAGTEAAAAGTDTAALKTIADTWNTAFDHVSLPDNPGLYAGFGPYNLVGFTEDGTMTFEAREDYTWGPAPQVQTIVYSIIGDPTAAVQAMANEEVDIIQPQSTADILTELQAIADRGVTVRQADGATYEHVDLAQNNGGPFDPATYGGDAETARMVREAFLKTVPRQEIVDRLIVPLNENATVRNSLTAVPGSPDYDNRVAVNGSDAYAEVDIEGATALLAEAGVTTPLDVRMLFADPNPRRAQEYELIRDSAAQAGFNVIDGRRADWGSQLSNTSIYDVALFGWQTTSINVADSQANFATGGLNNFYGYSNPEVDALYEELVQTSDPARQTEILDEVEAILYADAFGLPIFQFPEITAWNSTYVEGVSSIPIAPTVFFNFWEWTAAA